MYLNKQSAVNLFTLVLYLKKYTSHRFFISFKQTTHYSQTQANNGERQDYALSHFLPGNRGVVCRC
jgi:hypothetical protein